MESPVLFEQDAQNMEEDIPANARDNSYEGSYEQMTDMTEDVIRSRVRRAGEDPVAMSRLASTFYAQAREMDLDGGNREIINALEDEAGRLMYMAAIKETRWCCAKKCTTRWEAASGCIEQQRVAMIRSRRRDARRRKANRCLKEWCCKSRCVRINHDQVDGRACKKCNYFSYCRCKCRTAMKEHQWAWCCSDHCCLVSGIRCCMYQNCERCHHLASTLCRTMCRNYSENCIEYRASAWETFSDDSSSDEEEVHRAGHNAGDM
ncbi:hypothetical protein V9T40_012680 [Parthenolecanium corni]|uniref:Uncharacterized protein n=1 Tax=Parthenolecanium corni TaxID=536013 RepID=A0AAN9XZN2_9HEMI